MARVAQNPGVLLFGHPAAEAAARELFGKLLLLALFFLTIVLDFRRVEGDDNPFVMIMGIANVLLGAWYIALYRHFTPWLYYWISPFLLLIGIGTLTGVLYGENVYVVVSHTIPILSFLLAAIAIYTINGDAEKKAAISIILATGFIAAVAKFVLGFYYYDLNMENVRYQVIAGSVPLVFAYGVAGLFSKGKRFAILSIFLAVFIVTISVTRTYILVFGLSSLICLYSYTRTASRLSGVLAISIVGLILTVTLTELFPEVLGRWSYRLLSTENGFDLSAAYRLAETDFQLRRLWSDTSGLLFGFGHGAKSGLAGENVRHIANELGRAATDWSSVGYGHNLYVGLLYVGGLVAGVPVLVALLHLFWKGLRQARRTASSPMDQFLLSWGVSAFAGYLAYGTFGGSFGDRSISFYFGVSAGLVLLGTEPARHVVNQVIRLGAVSDTPTPQQRRAALAREARQA